MKHTIGLPAAVLLVLMPAMAWKAAVAENSKPSPHPNVVLMISDDQGWGDVHSHGHPLIDTPVLDRLAEKGARFNQFYVSPVCAPTRACLLTGRYFLRTGVHGVTRGHETMRAEEWTLGEIFKAHGYATGCFGKWHNGAHYPHDPNGQGFEEFLGFCAGHWNNYFDTTLQHNDRMVRVKGYITDVLTDAAIEFIRAHQGQPFFCYVPYNTPHSPFQVPDRYYEKYRKRGFDPPEATVYGMVENVDDNVGRILDELRKLGLERDTIVMFLTDNGANTERYDAFMRERKGSVHEGGVRVPLFVQWKGHIPAGTVVNDLSAHIDLLPSLLELCGLEAAGNHPLDGRSFARVLLKETKKLPDRTLFQFWGDPTRRSTRGAVRTARYRLVNQGRGWELYDLIADPNEQVDISSEQSGRSRRLETAYGKWFEEVTSAGFEPIPIPLGFPQRPEVVLPGHEAYLEPGKGRGIAYNGPSGWANDWIDAWVRSDAYPWWPVRVVEEATYEIWLRYTCSEVSLGSLMRVDVNGQSVRARIPRVHDPDPIPSPDRVPRKEVHEKEWEEMRVGAVELNAGEGRLSVHAVEKQEGEVMDLKAVVVKRIP